MRSNQETAITALTHVLKGTDSITTHPTTDGIFRHRLPGRKKHKLIMYVI